ncbi:MAG: SDR family NAD(P)-dependent oxidoreductase [Nitrospirota bacterium]
MARAVNGLVVLITGASSGIGRETALLLGAEEAKLGLVARREGRLREVADAIRGAGGSAEIFAGDVGSPETLDSAVRGCVERFGRLDVLVNNAGAGLFATVEQTTIEDLEAMLAVNLRGTFHGIKAALPVMRGQGAGHIINVASTAGRRGSPYVGAYCAAKFAVVGLTESLRTELLGTGIDVSLVLPGATRTDFFDAACRRTERHRGLVGPVEDVRTVAARIVGVIRRPRAEVIAQPVRRRAVLGVNLVAASFVDRLLARMIAGGTAGHD